MAAVLENPLQYAGLVSHEAVNANLEKPLHLLFVIDGPDMDLNAASVRSPYEAGRRDRDGMEVRRDLHDGEVDCWACQAPARQPDAANTSMAGRSTSSHRAGLELAASAARRTTRHRPA